MGTHHHPSQDGHTPKPPRYRYKKNPPGSAEGFVSEATGSPGDTRRNRCAPALVVEDVALGAVEQPGELGTRERASPSGAEPEHAADEAQFHGVHDRFRLRSAAGRTAAHLLARESGERLGFPLS